MGCGASAATESPYLFKYFAAIENAAKREFETTEELMESGALLDPLKRSNYKQRVLLSRQALEEETDRLLDSSFDHHDKSGDGILSPTESRVFFSHLVNVKVGSDKAFAAWSLNVTIEAGIEAIEKFTKRLGHTLSSKDKDEIKKQSVQALRDLKDQMNQAIADYEADKENRDRKAFDLIDVNKDGMLQKKEFIAVFDVLNGSRQAVLFKVLGFTIESSALQKMTKPDGEIEVGGECSIQ